VTLARYKFAPARQVRACSIAGGAAVHPAAPSISSRRSTRDRETARPVGHLDSPVSRDRRAKDARRAVAFRGVEADGGSNGIESLAVDPD
jgi:hypothetical protein